MLSQASDGSWLGPCEIHAIFVGPLPTVRQFGDDDAALIMLRGQRQQLLQTGDRAIPSPGDHTRKGGWNTQDDFGI
jgi:hypothetical protein